jgi:hypothetical protein
MRAIAGGLRNATAASLALPDSVYLMNVWDEGRCAAEAASGAPHTRKASPTRACSCSQPSSRAPHAARLFGARVWGGRRSPKACWDACPQARVLSPPCSVPLFSLIKSWDYVSNTSRCEERGRSRYSHTSGLGPRTVPLGEFTRFNPAGYLLGVLAWGCGAGGGGWGGAAGC